MNWDSDDEDSREYEVVVNHEEQYSTWLAHKDNPLGWRDVGPHGSKDECLKYIGEVWTDMRPLSLRKKMEEAEASRPSSVKIAEEAHAVERRRSETRSGGRQ